MQQLAKDDNNKAFNDTATGLLQVVQELVTELHPHQATTQSVTLDSELARNLGLDSLARVELLSRIEQQFAITLPERVFTEAETPRDLLRAVLTTGAPTKPLKPLEPSELNLGMAEIVPHDMYTLIEGLH